MAEQQVSTRDLTNAFNDAVTEVSSTNVLYSSEAQVAAVAAVEALMELARVGTVVKCEQENVSLRELIEQNERLIANSRKAVGGG